MKQCVVGGAMRGGGQCRVVWGGWGAKMTREKRQL